MKQRFHLLPTLLLMFLFHLPTVHSSAQELDYERVHELVVAQDDAALDTLLTRWYYSGLYPADVLNYHYNELQGMDDWGIYLAMSESNLVGKLILQRVLHVHRDKVLVDVNALYDSTYMATMCRRMEVPVPQEYFGDGRFVLMTQWVGRHAKRQVYLSASAMNMICHPAYLDANDPQALHIDSVATELKSCLYNEGLTMHYARTPYNNIVVKCRNLEQRYLLDYLRMTFTPPRGKEQEGALSFTRSTLAENYRILYEGLLPYYRAHRPERLAWLEQLIRDALNYRRMQERREREYNQVSRLL